MTATLSDEITAKANQALGNLESVQHKARVMAEQARPASSSDWAAYANELAEAEGQAQTWARFRNVVDYAEREHLTLDKSMVQEIALDMLSNGADDGWSGRTNDVKRAHFDGVRKAVSNTRYL